MRLHTVLLLLSSALQSYLASAAPYDSSSTKKNSVLYQAVDAFRQAKKLERDLSDSEDAVSAQTRELTRELQEAKTAAGQNPSSFFTREQRLDEQLLRQAQSETRKDARLVAQAKDEMENDQEYLEDSFQVNDPDDLPDLQDQTSTAATDSKLWLNKKCPGMLCVRAVSFDYLPPFCTLSEDIESCPNLECYDYSEIGTCEGASELGFTHGRICVKPDVADCTKGTAPRPRKVEDRMGMLILLILLSLGAGGAYFMFRRQASLAMKKPPPVPAYYGRL